MVQKNEPVTSEDNTGLVKGSNTDNIEQQVEIARLQQKAISITDSKSFMIDVVNTIQKTLKSDFVIILEFSEVPTKAKMIEGLGWKIESDTLINLDPNYISYAMNTLIDKNPVIVLNFEDELRFKIPKRFQEHGIKSGITIIISGKRKPFGILGAHFRQAKNFTEADKNFLSTVSFILSSVLMQQEHISDMKKEKEKYRILMEYASDAIVIFDQQGKILNVNTKACELTNFSKEELETKIIDQLFYEHDLQQVPIKYEEVLRGETVLLERNLKTRDLKTKKIEISSTLLPNGTIQGIYRDITARKETEHLLTNIQKMEAIERVSASLVHDFNNYLSVIHGYTEKLLHSFPIKDVDEIFQDVEQIQKIVNRSSSLTREVYRFSSITEEKVEQMNINTLVSELDETISILSGPLISVTYELDPTLHLTEYNMNQFQQLVINLVINAKDAIQDSGSIIIKTFNYLLEKAYINYAFNAQPGKYVALSIKDTGCGMSEEVLAHVFEPFYTTKKEKGTGLGLSSIYGFVKKYNGFISIKTELNAGTDITIFLK